MSPLIRFSALLLASGAQETPPHIDCMTGPFVVSFDADSADLDEEDRKILDIVAEAAAATLCWDGVEVNIEGHRGAVERTVISSKRATVVAEYLGTHGLSYDRITQSDLGDRRPGTAGPGGVAEPQNRRVEIIFGPLKEELFKEGPDRDTKRP